MRKIITPNKSCWQMLHDIIQARGLSKPHFCNLTGLDEVYYRRAETNPDTKPSKRAIVAVACGLDMDLDKLGGTDIREYKLDSLLSNISMVFQNVFLFADSIENNIKFGKPDATHEEVVRAAKSACCHDFIMALPNGYDTVIGESGATLSGGEKQRISIARAILKDTPIIILDEATSSVDPENEAELQQAIEKLTEDKTVIIIAHRLKTVRNAQQIVVIANGGIAQRGTHQELMTQPGIYADFVNIREKAVNWKISSSKIQQ